MCGICGLVNLDPQEPASEALLGRMAAALAHRGPDGQRLMRDRFVGLGHRHLAIVDRTASAAQPMRNEDGTIWVIFNGEIYNYRALRENLIHQGHRFHSNTDTEVLVHLYEEYGTECVTHLRGMFAFAIWDRPQAQLFLARDRLGKKPLYYTQTPERFLFASEIKALWQDASLERQVNVPAIHQYLSLSYIPGPQTAFQNIYQLPPAHTLTLRHGVSRLECYWHLSFTSTTSNPALDLRQVQAEILERLKQAVATRMVAEAPVGVLLSGGIDSSLIVALMAQLSAKPVQTFSIGLPERQHDESGFARQIAAQFHTDHHEFPITPQLADLLPQVAGHFDEPFGDSSALPTYYLAQRTKPYITVALNGDGSDEDFAGYDRYTKDRLAIAYAGLPAPLRALTAGVLSRAVPGALPGDSLLKRVLDFTHSQYTTPAQRYFRWVSVFQAPQVQTLYTPDFWQAGQAQTAEALVTSIFDAATNPDPTQAALHTDILTYLADDLLVKMDRAAMAFAVETRSPFLDQEIMEYAAGLPASLKIRGWTRKWILKQAARSLLPPAIIQRPKHGFGLPVGEWLRGPLRPMLCDVVLSQRALQRGYFQPAALRALLEDHLAGRQNWQYQLWNILMLELWQMACVEAPRISTEPLVIQPADVFLA